MDPFVLKLTYEFSMCPTKLKLDQLHHFLNTCSTEKLNGIKYLFFNVYFKEIRKASDFSVNCMEELLYLLKLLNTFDDGKILSIVLEEVCTFIQMHIAIKSREKQPDDFGCLNISLALDVLKIFHIIFYQINYHKVEEIIYSQSCLLLLGYVVSFLLFYVEFFKEREIQNEALESLNNIFSVKTKNIVNRADIIVTFAPGILQSLTRIIKADRKTGSSVKSRALKCLGKLIVLIYGEKSLIKVIDKNRQQKVIHELKEVMVVRDENWQNATWTNIIKIIKIVKYSILECSEEEHWRVRLELLKMCIAVLENCSYASVCAADLIECFIALKSDADLTVQDEANKCIGKVAKMVFNIPIYWDAEKKTSSQVIHSGKLLLATVIRENLDKFIDSLKDLGAVVSDQVKCNILQVLDGFLAIHVNESLQPPSFVQVKRIIYHLINICKLDNSLLDLSEPFVNVDETMQPEYYTRINCEFFPKRFVHFHNERVYSIVQSIMSHITIISLPTYLVPMLQSLMDEMPDDISTIVLLTKLMIRSITGNNSMDSVNQICIIKSILTTYFHFELINLKTTITDDIPNHNGDFWTDAIASLTYDKQSDNTVLISNSSKTHTPAMLKQNSLILALIMELCAACCLCLRHCSIEEEDIDSWVMRTCLFEVMNKSQQSPHILSRAATMCFHVLALVHPKYTCSTSVLVRINADYIMDSIARRLRSTAVMLKSRCADNFVMTRTDSACRCLVTLCRQADIEIIPFLDIIIRQLFYCIDETHGIVNELFMQVLKEVTLSVCRWKRTVLNPVLSIADSSQVNKEPLSKVMIVREYLVQRNDLLVSSGFRKDTVDDTSQHLLDDKEDESHLSDNEEEEAEPQKSELSKEVTLIQNISYRCIHLMSNSNPLIRLSCLDILNDAVIVLQKEDFLNALIHKIWEPLEHRLWDKEYPVIIKAFNLVNSISQLSGDFLYTKVRNNFVLKLSTILERCAKINTSQISLMKYSGIYQLQKNLLIFLSNLCIRTGIHGYELEQIVDSFLLFLSDQQPAELIETCEESLKLLFKLDPCLIWFKLLQILSLNECTFDDVHNQIFSHVNHLYDVHYLSNTQKLLNELNFTVQ